MLPVPDAGRVPTVGACPPPPENGSRHLVTKEGIFVQHHFKASSSSTSSSSSSSSPSITPANASLASLTFALLFTSSITSFTHPASSHSSSTSSKRLLPFVCRNHANTSAHSIKRTRYHLLRI
ncbi:unnamed protein product [Sympodiomycopsis kandeliae]